MKILGAGVASLSMALSFSLLASVLVQAKDASAAPGGEAQTLTITRSGSQASRSAPAEHFTGLVRVDPLFQPTEPARTSGASVTFEPRAHTAWHTHPLGQTLIVTAGSGRVQRWGGPVVEIRPGDVVQIAPGQKHWHGAAPNAAMSHIALQENLNGKTVDWLEKVSEAQYGGTP